MATALVGREKELGFLTARLGEAEAGNARFAAVEGDPGMGKSRLLRELVERASGRGCVVLHGRAAEFEREMPFGLFVDALDSFLEAAPGSAFGALDQEQVDELASAFPAMRPLASGDSPPRPPKTGSGSTAPPASCSAAWRRARPSSSPSTTCTGATGPRSS